MNCKIDSIALIESSNMSLGSSIDNVLGRFLRHSDEPRSRMFMDSLIQAGRKEIIFVTGEFDKTFYTHEIGKSVANSLSRGAILYIVLTEIVQDNKDESIKALALSNFAFFYAIYKSLTENLSLDIFCDSINIYFSIERPEKHFAVIDNDVFIESYHAKGKPRSVYINSNTAYLAKKYSGFFKDKIVKSEKVYKIDSSELLKCIVTEINKKQKDLKC